MGHGCVRLPLKFAELLYTVTSVTDLPVDRSTQSDPGFKVIGLWQEEPGR
jgi:hypothetical protein